MTLEVRRQNTADTSACHYRLFIGRSTTILSRAQPTGDPMMRSIPGVLALTLLACCTPRDVDAPPDLGTPRDLGAPPDLGVASDLGWAIDLSVPPDLGAPTDLGVPADFAVPSDLGVPDDGGLPDLGPLVAGVSPDGMGYCCEPRRSGNCGSPSFYRGGYAARTSDCLLSLTDTIWVPTTLEFVDAHGCVYLDLMTAMSCITPL